MDRTELRRLGVGYCSSHVFSSIPKRTHRRSQHPAHPKGESDSTIPDNLNLLGHAHSRPQAETYVDHYFNCLRSLYLGRTRTHFSLGFRFSQSLINSIIRHLLFCDVIHTSLYAFTCVLMSTLGHLRMAKTVLPTHGNPLTTKYLLPLFTTINPSGGHHDGCVGDRDTVRIGQLRL